MPTKTARNTRRAFKSVESIPTTTEKIRASETDIPRYSTARKFIPAE